MDFDPRLRESSANASAPAVRPVPRQLDESAALEKLTVGAGHTN